jgi:hypothetical protein
LAGGHNVKIVLIGIVIMGLFGMVGCASHKHCGTAHYSELTSQDFQNMKQNMQVENFLLNTRGME